jgi:hypothetical protein
MTKWQKVWLQYFEDYGRGGWVWSEQVSKQVGIRIGWM